MTVAKYKASDYDDDDDDDDDYLDCCSVCDVGRQDNSGNSSTL